MSSAIGIVAAVIGLVAVLAAAGLLFIVVRRSPSRAAPATPPGVHGGHGHQADHRGHDADSAAHRAPQSCSLARIPAPDAGSPCGEALRAPSAASILGGESQLSGGGPQIPGSLATPAAGDRANPARGLSSLANLLASSRPAPGRPGRPGCSRTGRVPQQPASQPGRRLARTP